LKGRERKKKGRKAVSSLGGKKRRVTLPVSARGSSSWIKIPDINRFMKLRRGRQAAWRKKIEIRLFWGKTTTSNPQPALSLVGYNSCFHLLHEKQQAKVKKVTPIGKRGGDTISAALVGGAAVGIFLEGVMAA